MADPLPTNDRDRRTTLPQDESAQLTGQVWGDVELGEMLGSGGMGQVYRGRQISLDRTVAVKVLARHLSVADSFRARFLKEARVVAGISSPHVVQVYRADVYQGLHYFVMEFVDGTDLSQRLKAGWKPGLEESVHLMLQAARGLAAAHRVGVVHRDIKPGNMLLARDGTLKLSDFGLVKLADDSDGNTASGLIVGTVAYFSPEQAQGERLDHRADLYALGVVLYELCVGRLPFSGDDPAGVIYQHVHVPPVPPRRIQGTIHPDLERLILRLLAKKPDDRPADAATVVRQLEDLLSHGHIAVAGQAVDTAVGLPWLLAAGLGGAAVILGAAWWLWPNTAPRASTPLDPFAAPADASASTAAVDVASAFDQLPGSQPQLTPVHEPEPPLPAALPFIPFSPLPPTAISSTTPLVMTPASTPAVIAPVRIAATTPALAMVTLPVPPRVERTPIVRIEPPLAPAAVALTPATIAVQPLIRPAGPSSLAEPRPDVIIMPPGSDVITPEPLAIVQEAAPPADDGAPAWASRDQYGAYVDISVGRAVQRLRWLPAGTFVMGSPTEERHRRDDETQHRVTIPTGFWLADSECTQLLWHEVMGSLPSSVPGMDHPVEMVNWDDTQRFLLALNAAVPGLQAKLPSEAEWEYAARAGTDGPWPAPLRWLGWFSDTSGRAHQSVKSLKPNAWGLYDQHGNIAEWVYDGYGPYPTMDGDDTPRQGGAPVVRGGSFKDDASAGRSAARTRERGKTRSAELGFRWAASSVPNP